MANLLLFPLHGAVAVLWVAALVVRIWALVDALIRPDAAYRAAGKLSKLIWCLILVVGLFLWLPGLVAALVYLIDVRPAIRQIGSGRGPSSSDGPYGPYRR